MTHYTIKPLEWRPWDDGTITAATQLGLYQVCRHRKSEWHWFGPNTKTVNAASLEAAKAAAEAHYRARLLPALEPVKGDHE